MNRNSSRLGIFHYDQIAGWTSDEAAWVSEEIGFPGRAHREGWVKQAAGLVKPVAKAKPKAAPKKARTEAGENWQKRLSAYFPLVGEKGFSGFSLFAKSLENPREGIGAHKEQSRHLQFLALSKS